MHYAFETESAVHRMLDNVARYLRKRGRFIGTIPNADFMAYVSHIPSTSAFPSLLAVLMCAVSTNAATDRTELRKIPERARLEFGNVYRIKLEPRHQPGVDDHGHQYHST